MATDTQDPVAGQQDANDAATMGSGDPRREAVKAASEIGVGKTKGEMTPEAQSSALSWFLSDEEMPLSKTLDVNLGTPDNTRRVEWTIQAIDGDTIKRARKQSEEGGNRAQRRNRQVGAPAEVDTNEANLRIVVAGTLDPDLREAAALKMKNAGETTRHPDPDVPAVMLLKHRLRHKPGLVDQIAGEILGLSGYDDDDIQEHQAGKL